MKLYASKIPSISSEVVKTLVSAGDIETGSPKRVEDDLSGALKHYLDVEKLVNEKTKDLLEQTGRGTGDYGRVRQQIAESNGIKVGDEMLDHLLDKCVDMLMNSDHVDEVFAQDVELRRRMVPVFKKYIMADADLDAEVRTQIRHVKEGTRDWDIEYQKVMEITKRKRGIS